MKQFYLKATTDLLLGMILILGVVLLVLTGCKPYIKRISVTTKGTIEIINVHLSSEDIQNTAVKLKQQLESEKRNWDVILLPYANKEQALLFDKSLQGTDNPENLHVCYEAGVESYNCIIANKNTMELLEFPINWYKGLSGDNSGWFSSYTAVGAKFKMKSVGKTIPIALYTSTAWGSSAMKAPDTTQKHFTDETRNVFRGTDLTMLISGFPLDQSELERGEGIKSSFNEATMVLEGMPAPEGIWIGKERAYPETEGTMMFKEYKYWYFHGNPITYAKMYPTYWEFEKKFDTPPRARSNSRPILLSVNKTLYIVWNGRNQDGDFVIIKTKKQPPVEFDINDRLYILRDDTNARLGSNYSPSLAYFKKRWFIAWFTRNKQELRIRSQAGPDGHIRSEIWDSKIAFEFGSTVSEALMGLHVNRSDAPPSLVAIDERLFIAWKVKGCKNIFIMDSADGENWSLPRDVGVRTSSGPSLAYFKDKLFISWVGDSEKHILIQSSSDNGYTWGNKKKLNDTNSNYPPLLFALSKEERPNRENHDILYLAYTRFNGNIQIKCSKDGIHWSDASRALYNSVNTPSLIYHDYRFILGWSRSDDENFINIKGSKMFNEAAIDFYR